MLRTFLVCFQFFVSFMLIIAVGIMYLQSRYIQHSDYGYDKEVVLVGTIPYEYLDRREAIVSELSGLSGIEGISISQFVLSSTDKSSPLPRSGRLFAPWIPSGSGRVWLMYPGCYPVTPGINSNSLMVYTKKSDQMTDQRLINCCVAVNMIRSGLNPTPSGSSWITT
jgi:hypothetical protein